MNADALVGETKKDQDMNSCKVKLLLWASVLVPTLFLSSCKKEQGVDEPSIGKVSYSLEDYVVTEEAATKQAEELVGLLDRNSLRSAKRSIANITPIGVESLRSISNEAPSIPLAYVVNFANDLGYVILSADTRLKPV